jgi:hypothetical protein
LEAAENETLLFKTNSVRKYPFECRRSGSRKAPQRRNYPNPGSSHIAGRSLLETGDQWIGSTKYF